ncbi:hypothetical protein QIS74_06439 [Colletotrichum tabaci]|uniref:Uncharacterized protein n=1 Tax=Colletotrichum tabaci TaxID=1209068 RepID=A0AAV9TFB8_9PEZI
MLVSTSVTTRTKTSRDRNLRLRTQAILLQAILLQAPLLQAILLQALLLQATLHQVTLLQAPLLQATLLQALLGHPPVTGTTMTMIAQASQTMMIEHALLHVVGNRLVTFDMAGSVSRSIPVRGIMAILTGYIVYTDGIDTVSTTSRTTFSFSNNFGGVNGSLWILSVSNRPWTYSFGVLHDPADNRDLESTLS